MRVAALQYDTVWHNPTANYERLAPWIDAAAAAKARLMILPETFPCGFSMDTAAVAEPVDGPSTRFLQEHAARTGMWICGSIPERAEGEDRPRNTLVFAAPDGAHHRYAKIHPFTYANEHDHYAAGTEFLHLEIDEVRVTPFICYDLRFADEFWQTAARTDLYVVPANWPETRRNHWSTLLRARAIENQAYVAGVNRVGEGGGLKYSGDSAIIDPLGEVLAEASRDETLLIADVDPERVKAVRERLPFMQDRR